MRKALFITVALLLLVLVLAGPAAAQSKSNAPLRCVADIAVTDYNPFPPSVENRPFDWFGPISGDINGDIGYWERANGAFNTFPGKTEHFIEDWIIYVGGYGSDVTISGYQVGVYTFSNFKFRANGWVTDASPQFRWLIGHRTHAMGVTVAGSDTGPVYISAPHTEIFIAGR